MRAEPQVGGVVAVGEVVGVEHDPLHVDLAVADPDVVRNVMAAACQTAATQASAEPVAVGRGGRGSARAGRRPRPGPAPPGLVRRATDDAGLEQARSRRSSKAGWAATRSASGTCRRRASRGRAPPTMAWASRNGVPRDDELLGEVGGGGVRACRRPPASRAVSKRERGEQPGHAPRGPSATWSTASNSGSLSSWRSRL